MGNKGARWLVPESRPTGTGYSMHGSDGRTGRASASFRQSVGGSSSTTGPPCRGSGTGQDDFGGYRFQLAYMIYALALAHRHRLPAAPGLFRPTFERLIEKMLLPEVWLYWRTPGAAASSSTRTCPRATTRSGTRWCATTSCTAPTCSRWPCCTTISSTRTLRRRGRV